MTPAQIRQLREKLHLTQRQLAEHLLVTRETVARWEANGRVQTPQKVHIEAMRKLAGLER